MPTDHTNEESRSSGLKKSQKRYKKGFEPRHDKNFLEMNLRVKTGNLNMLLSKL